MGERLEMMGREMRNVLMERNLLSFYFVCNDELVYLSGIVMFNYSCTMEK